MAGGAYLKMKSLGTLGETIICKPPFPGCGLVDPCVGDILVGATLYEFKSVDRTFRSHDFRQVLVYAALSHACDAYTIETTELINLRRGVAFRASVDELIEGMSGRDRNWLLQHLVDFMTADPGSGQ